MPAKAAVKKTSAKKVAAKKAPAKKVAAKKAAGKPLTSLRIRMYRVGFGDFFLITVPTDSGPQHIVVDCGVYDGPLHNGDIATIKTAVRHMAEETDSKLALIIVTHRHADHIIGFSRCKTEFENFTVDAIWMSIWETEYEPKIKKFQADLEQLALDLGVALAGRQDAVSEQILGFAANASGEGPGGGSNAKSLELLKTKLGVEPEYLTKGDTPKLPPALRKAGLTAEILGPPPAEEFKFLKLMDLKKHVGQYLDSGDRDDAAGNVDGQKPDSLPFETKYVASSDDYPVIAFREWMPRVENHSLHDYGQRYPEQLEEGVRASTPAALALAAKTLDDYLNNQSLVVLFGWKGKTLLFAGDAQGGNWEYWLYGDATPTTDPTQLTMTEEAEKILRDMDFYKVGHHGSTNATPKPAVEAMGRDFVSMCSTQAKTYGSQAKESEVPRDELIDALAKKSALVRSDQIEVSVGNVHVEPDPDVDTKMPKPKSGRFEVGSCYVDYFLDP
jgi:beta-lactamase superfamily II metal-dependent hydrolase